MKPADLIIMLLLVLGFGWWLWPTPDEIDAPVSVTIEGKPREYDPLRVDGSGELRINTASGQLWISSTSGDQTVNLWCIRGGRTDTAHVTCSVDTDGHTITNMYNNPFTTLKEEQP